jgi:probable H4MPT-linked C1 transfer pathway protein
VATVIGWDIGGVNTKAVLLRQENDCIEELRTMVEYFPVWKDPTKLVNVLSLMKKKLVNNIEVDGVGLTMTAELSDAYSTKREGVGHVLECVEEAFAGSPIFVTDINAKLKPIEAAKAEPISVAAANWAATGWLATQLLKTCVVVDVGSTSTSIIPVIDKRIYASGKNDLEKLMNGELIYTGSLRTNVAAIVGSIPLKGSVARVASELFSQSGDVHLILNNISEEEYTTETADGHGKTRGEAVARLARVVCADAEMLSEEEIMQIAQYVYERQVEQIADGLRQVYSRIKLLANSKVPVVVTGIGKKFLAETSARKIGVDEIVDLEKLCFDGAFNFRISLSSSEREGVAKASPAFGVALMTVNKLNGSYA